MESLVAKCKEGVVAMPEDMIGLHSVERYSEMGLKTCLEVSLHPISFLRKWVSELTGFEGQGKPLSTFDGKLDTSLCQKTFLLFWASVSSLFFRSEEE